ncbi:SGM_5486 family transporter-associated protein [Streptomyces sp. LP05-1]|uniref:SGM_5486 family transporter-associated protein n=1 Tax=Streptomyces pyxinae TaxID=2970734 RepID=A0ABT2CIJ7_9ACTN|nr:SGM_5486 family transporter-associated protein [Streptomyces sp. LP05-1]MCS0637241.1 SGM_5486 family transporter-associated protein [Streptomyces sp. LP05-1]
MQQPVLDPDPQNGQKKLLTVFGVMLAIGVLIAIIASIAAP